jgi:hypothetical protein
MLALGGFHHLLLSFVLRFSFVPSWQTRDFATPIQVRQSLVAYLQFVSDPDITQTFEYVLGL